MTLSEVPSKTAQFPANVPADTAPQVLVLPDSTSPAARVVTLCRPQDSTPGRYFFCPDKGLYEFTKVAAPKAAPRSWLLSRSVQSDAASSKTQSTSGHLNTDNENKSLSESDGVASPLRRGEDTTSMETAEGNSSLDTSAGYMVENANLLIATPYDPLFLLLPVLRRSKTGANGAKKQPNTHLLHPASEYFDLLASESPHISFVLSHPATSSLFESRLACICESVDAGDEKMYRLSETKLLQELLRKARQAIKNEKGKKAFLPSSMENKFVSRALEVPVASISRAAEGTSGDDQLKDEGETRLDDTEGKLESSPATDSEGVHAEESIAHLLRLQTVLQFIMQSYLPPHLTATMQALLEQISKGSSTQTTTPCLELGVDFGPLNSRLSHLSRLRAEAAASRSRDDFARKRPADGSDEATLAREDKRRRKEEEVEEEKRKKAGETRAMRDLKKADVTGMKKMSDFFAKKQSVARPAARGATARS
ncbi:MAG: hypothetical protein M4579_000625 [Chaenotheca gracillima]|nr:MAG: hypothetical protein M4579_000625 [Chaenotheca gracillima]